MRRYFRDSVTGRLVYMDDSEKQPMQSGSDLQSAIDMLGMKNYMPYKPPEMKYFGDETTGSQQQKSGNMNMLQQLLQMQGSGLTGMTPNAVNAYGEPFYGWGSKTGDWGAGSSVPFDASQYGSVGASGESGGESGVGFLGGSGTGPSGPGGYGGALGYAGIVAAAIAAQHAMSNATSRRFEGQQTKDAFGGSYATEPWLAYGFDKFGINSPTAGESFDAAWQNNDWENVAERSPRAMGYWGEPGTSVGYDVASDKMGEKAANAIFPNQYFLQQFGQLIGKLF